MSEYRHSAYQSKLKSADAHVTFKKAGLPVRLRTVGIAVTVA